MYVNLVFRYVEVLFVKFLLNNYVSVIVLMCVFVVFVCLYEVGEGEEEGGGGILKLDLEEWYIFIVLFILGILIICI